MCQAYEGEHHYVRSLERDMRQRGYEAHAEGVARADIPATHMSADEMRQWWNGWDTANQGGELW